MNLTNFRETPVARVVEMIRREAERYGVGVHHSELVGLIPEEALLGAATWYLQLDEFDAEQVLERRLASAIGQGRQSLSARQPEAAVELTPAVASAQNDGSETGDAQARADGFLDALAEGTAAPGGGSAAAYAGALASALAAMVARLTIGKAKYASVEAQMASLLAEAESLRAGLAGAVWRDAAAFEAVMAAYRLPRGTPDEQQARTRAIETATLRATAEPLGAARQTVRVMELLSQVIRDGNRNAITDAACGLALAKAGLAGARLNVQANLRSLPDTPAASQMAEDLRSLEARAAEVEREAGAALQARAGLVMA
jgi:glutamate formiminotransferase/formiminotetrahydrofolate cyclodeaminase